MRKRSEVKPPSACAHESADGVHCTWCGALLLPREPTGEIVDCAMASGKNAYACAMCAGHCPDAAKYTGAQLAKELRKPPQTGLRPSPESTPEVEELFKSVNQVRGAELRPDMQRMVDSLFSLPDLDAEYSALEGSLTVGEKRGDYATVAQATDEAEEMARRAHKLYCNASLERTRFERDAEVVEGALWGAASESLEQEKAAGNRRKAITDADVRLKCAEMFPDQWKHVEMTRARVKLMVEHCEQLSALWKARCSATESLLKSVRK